MTDSNPATWHAYSSSEVAQKLETTKEKGLSFEEAAQRLEEYGRNELAEAPPPTFLEMLWDQLKSFVVIMLIIASIVSALLGDYIEAAAIMTIVVLNAVLGVVQERNAQNALAALKKLAAPDANVLRAGSRQSVRAYDLVPGDIVLLEAGNYIPADLRLVETMNLRVEEAALTGESVPVQKDASITLAEGAGLGDLKNMGFMGTLISYGRGKGIVVNTGMKTQIGRIAELLNSVEEEPTPLQRRLEQLGRTLGIGAMVICVFVFLLGWFQGNDPLEMFIVAVSLAIAAVPEGLPAVVTISLALGMRQMIRRHALIRRLASVETLGSATVICSDKTGTLTQNQMMVTRVYTDGHFFSVTGRGYAPNGEFSLAQDAVNLSDYPAARTALWISALNNDAVLEEIQNPETKSDFRMVGDPTEGALVVAAAKAGFWANDLNRSYPRIAEIPFDSVRKRMVTIHTEEDATPELRNLIHLDINGQHIITVKGAPDMVLDLCTHYLSAQGVQVPLTPEKRVEILEANDTMAQDALRVLGMAFRLTMGQPAWESPEQVEHSMVFVGLTGMIDPPRPEVPPAIEIARKAGIRTILITGDYANTARAIAAEIGLIREGHLTLTGAELNGMSDEELRQQVKVTDVFARVSPEHKLRIVDALQTNGEVVAMTGDGVNDAPSIKKSDIGVAMGITGTDVAKESADMVLTDDNYASIVSAVEEGRVIYSNIRKFVYFLLSCNLAEIAVIFLSTLFYRASALTAIQLLWLNLVTDGAPALALGTEKAEPGIMNRPPRPPSEPIINRFMQVGIVVQTIAITAVTLIAYILGRQLHPSEPQFAETMAFVTLSLSELARAFTARSEHIPVLKIGIFSNRNMNLAFLSSVILVLVVVYVPFLQKIFNTTPLGLDNWEVVLPLLLIPSIAAEAVKYFVVRRGK
jgi:Ca2+-transporting ATPase